MLKPNSLGSPPSSQPAGRWPRYSRAVHDREERRTRLHAELATLDGVPFTHFDAVTIERELRSYLEDWPSLAQRHHAQTRQILRKLLPSRIRVWRDLVGAETCSDSLQRAL